MRKEKGKSDLRGMSEEKRSGGEKMQGGDGDW